MHIKMVSNWSWVTVWAVFWKRSTLGPLPPLLLPRFRFHQHVVILLVAIPPTNLTQPSASASTTLCVRTSNKSITFTHLECMLENLARAWKNKYWKKKWQCLCIVTFYSRSPFHDGDCHYFVINWPSCSNAVPHINCYVIQYNDF